MIYNKYISQDIILITSEMKENNFNKIKLNPKGNSNPHVLCLEDLASILGPK